MKLVYIYGPPASGKLTVAKELAKITKYKLFHNHLTTDILTEIVDIKHKKFWNFVEDIGIAIIGSAAKYGVRGIIFTSLYVYPYKEQSDKMKKIVEKNKGKAYFVKLEPDKKELHKRVIKTSRKKYKKFSSKNKLSNFMKRYKLYEKLPYKNQLIIDNTKLPAKKVAQMIVKEFKLK